MGTLTIIPAANRPDLLAAKVAEALRGMTEAGNVVVAEIDSTLSDTAAFCAHYQVPLMQAVNCVVLEAKRAERTWYAVCVVLASTRADVNGLARKTLEARKVSFAPMEKAVAATSMEYGAITPVGLPNNWSLLVDKAIADAAFVVIGSGIRKSKLIVSGSFLAGLPNAVVLEGLGQVRG